MTSFWVFSSRVTYRGPFEQTSDYEYAVNQKIYTKQRSLFMWIRYSVLDLFYQE